MPTERPYVPVLELPWDELVRRVAAVAATGNRRARAELAHLVEEERRAQEEGREPGDVFMRLSASAVLRPIHGKVRCPPGATEGDTTA
jgi:hypothetical protein